MDNRYKAIFELKLENLGARKSIRELYALHSLNAFFDNRGKVARRVMV